MKNIINVFHFILIFLKNQSDVCEIKTVLIAVALLLANGFEYIKSIQTRKWDTVAKSKLKVLAKKSKKLLWRMLFSN